MSLRPAHSVSCAGRGGAAEGVAGDGDGGKPFGEWAREVFSSEGEQRFWPCSEDVTRKEKEKEEEASGTCAL